MSTTERKPSERAVEAAKEISALNWAEVKTMLALFDTGDDDKAKSNEEIVKVVATIVDKHFPPTLESELVAFTRDVVSLFGPYREQLDSPELDLLDRAQKLLTTYHQRKETKE